MKKPELNLKINLAHISTLSGLYNDIATCIAYIYLYVDLIKIILRA